MWILRYSYSLETDEIVQISSCLRKDKQYSIGRSRKNVFYIKNDKSISRAHITFRWSEDNVLTVTNEGKVTALDGRPLKLKESSTFKPNIDYQHSSTSKANSNKFNVDIGTKPNVVTFEWLECNVLTSRTPDDTTKFLQDFGFGVLLDSAIPTTRLSVVDFILKDDAEKTEKIYYEELYMVLNQRCKPMSLNSLKHLEISLTASPGKFDEVWDTFRKTALDNKIELWKISEDDFKLLTDSTFVVFSGTDDTTKMYQTWCFDALGSQVLFCGNVEELWKSCVHKIRTSKCILIRDSSFQVSSGTTPPSQMIDISMLIEMLKKNNVNSLLVSVKDLGHADEVKSNHKENPVESTVPPNKPSQSELVHDNDQEKIDNPPKRRRLNRSRVQPLNSLSFFVGGGDKSEPGDSSVHKKTNENIANDDVPTAKGKLSAIEENGSNIIEGNKDDRIDTELGVPTFERDNSIIKDSAENLDKIHQEEHILSRPLLPDNNPGIIIESDVETSMHRMEESSKASKTSKNHESQDVITPYMVDNKAKIIDQPSITSDTDSQEKAIKSDIPKNGESPKHSISRPQTLVDVINQTKHAEVQRVKSEVAEVQKGELTESALKDFSNLEIVENPSLIVRSDKYTEQSAPGEWQGRKNFKRFNKVWPKSRKDNDSLTNAAFLLTRNYVTIKEYGTRSPSRSRSTPAIELSKTPVEEAPDLSVLDEDDRLLMEMERMPTPSRKSTKTIDDMIDESDDERDGSFSFSRASSKTNGLFVGNEEDSDDENMADQILTRSSNSRARLSPVPLVTKESTASPRSNTTRDSSVHSRAAIPVAASQSESDSDDDDDEGPQFKFRRRF
ncbi:Xrs2 protein [Maudiozyma humilis]|uniref:Xrs2 protein n=1 Tax=Maudiozyma humilis TaxID=51915 RepID=A0AAV5SAL2_MAUHU|nr:Xrs2 protein [Kazachstania humilis]